MVDNPSGRSDTPVAAGNFVPMFQTEIERFENRLYGANWLRARTGSVVVIDDCDYAAPAP